jgi:hypothetical protein
MRPVTVRTSSAALLLAVSLACSSAPTTHPLAVDRSVITNAEIPVTGTESAYDMIQRLRPEYLRTKPTQTYVGASSTDAPPPALFLNGQHIGEIVDLRRIPAPSLSSVRYYNIEQGKRKFGMQYGGGVIEITYRTP